MLIQKNNIKKVAHAYRDKFLKIPMWNFFSYSIIKALLPSSKKLTYELLYAVTSEIHTQKNTYIMVDLITAHDLFLFGRPVINRLPRKKKSIA